MSDGDSLNYMFILLEIKLWYRHNCSLNCIFRPMYLESILFIFNKDEIWMRLVGYFIVHCHSVDVGSVAP